MIPAPKPLRTRRVLVGGASRSAFLAVWLVLLGVFAGSVASVRAAAPPSTIAADEFRAAFLAKIPQFVTWPEPALGPEDKEVVIALLGGGSFTNLLDPLLRDIRVGNRPIRLQSVPTVDGLPRCQILFVPAGRTDELSRLPAERREGLLTVGEGPGFTGLGGVFSLSVVDRKLTVNTRNARNARLELQSRLLSIARIER